MVPQWKLLLADGNWPSSSSWSCQGKLLAIWETKVWESGLDPRLLSQGDSTHLLGQASRSISGSRWLDTKGLWEWRSLLPCTLAWPSFPWCEPCLNGNSSSACFILLEPMPVRWAPWEHIHIGLGLTKVQHEAHCSHMGFGVVEDHNPTVTKTIAVPQLGLKLSINHQCTMNI